jgi:hypothetical protein
VTVVASVNCLDLPGDGHFAWDMPWQRPKKLRESSTIRPRGLNGVRKNSGRAGEAGAKARNIFNRLRPD